MPDTNTKWLIGVLAVLIVVLVAQHAWLRSDLAEIRTDIRRLDIRRRAVVITLGVVDQRLEVIEERLQEAPGD